MMRHQPNSENAAARHEVEQIAHDEQRHDEGRDEADAR